MSVTFILSGFKRPYTLRQQYEAIKSQTVQDFEIMLWINLVSDDIKFDEDIVNSCQSFISNSNYGVWGRFTAALNARTKYICVIDDDTIPGKKWLENCFNTLKTHDGVLSTRGALMNKGHDHQYPLPNSYTPIGWCSKNETVTRVDMGCHSWFFDKVCLKAFFAEAPNVFPPRFGEDMHLSYAVKKHFGMNTYIPPHPENDVDLWGSLPDTAGKYGEDEAAVSWSGEANTGMNRYWNFIRQNGYKIVAEEE